MLKDGEKHKNKLKNNSKKLFTNVCSFCIIIT